MDNVEKLTLQPHSERSRFASADGALIHFAYGGDLSGCAGEEHLIGDIQLVPREKILAEGNTFDACELNHRSARDALEDRHQGWRLQHAMTDDEDVLPRALSHIARWVEQQRLVVSGLDGFDLSQLRVGVIADDLGLGHHDVRM